MATEGQQLPVNGRKVARGRVTLPRALRMFWVGSAVVFVLMLVVSALEHRAGMDPMRVNPWARPFMDLLEYPSTYKLLHTAAFFDNVPTPTDPVPMPVAYPPFAATVMAPMYAAPNPIGFYLVVAGVWIALGVWGVRGALLAEGIGTATATLFPVSLVLLLFPIPRLVIEGNIELVLWIFVSLGVLAWVRGRDNWAAVLWGLAAAMKLYPIVLLMLLLPRRRYGATALGVATFVGASVLALWWLGPTMSIAWHGSLQNVFGYQGVRASEFSLRELAGNHSIFGQVKVVAMIARWPVAKLTLPYYACGGLVMLAAFFGKLSKMPMANQLLAVSVFMVSLPTVSYFHTLANLYPALVLLMFVLIDAEKAGVKVPGLTAAVMMFVPLFASWTIFTFQRVILFDGLVQASLLVGLFICAVEYPFTVPRRVEA
jgi:Glycosyltransferase family 87